MKRTPWAVTLQKLFGILKVILLLLFLKVTQNNRKHEEIQAVPIMELLCYL